MFKVGIGDKEYEVRFHYTEDKKKRRISNCEITSADGNKLCVGASVCAKTDNFVRTEGRKIALTRALQFFGREERTAFWKKYFEICKRS